MVDNLENKIEKEKIIGYDNGAKAILLVSDKDKTVKIMSTYTPPELRGQGIAEKLVDEGIKYAHKLGYELIPICSYAIKRMEKIKRQSK